MSAALNEAPRRPSRARIALVGGIYGKTAGYRATATHTPETTLEEGLRARGCNVDPFSHYASFDRSGFDVVHVHHLSYGAARAASDPGSARFVYTSHDGSAMSDMSGSAHRRLAAHLVMSRADAVVALSKTEADFQRRTYPLSGAIHAVIPNGIDLSNYCHARRNSAGNGRAWQALYVGQLTALKNVDILLHALALVEKPVELSLAYHNPALESPLTQLASDLGFRDRINFLGPKTPPELARLYQEADLFVLPSAGEALPSVITEAMACGTPIVATDVGGVREQLGRYGLLARPGAPGDLAAAIGRVLDNYEFFSGQGQEMSQRARNEFSIGAMVDRHLDLYNEVLRRPGRRRHSLLRAPINVGLRIGADLLCAKK